ncbi:unnamed protein product, partial [Closterium sp. Naga37s-1]
MALLLLVPCLLALLLSLTCHVDAAQWHDCGSQHVPVTVKNVTMLPDPPVAGSDFTVVLPAVTAARIQSGVVRVSVAYYGWPVYTSTVQLCDKTPCPVLPGAFTFSNQQPLPFLTPAGAYTLWLKARDSNGRELFCTRVDFTIVRPQAGGGAALSARADGLERGSRSRCSGRGGDFTIRAMAPRPKKKAVVRASDRASSSADAHAGHARWASMRSLLLLGGAGMLFYFLLARSDYSAGYRHGGPMGAWRGGGAGGRDERWMGGEDQWGARGGAMGRGEWGGAGGQFGDRRGFEGAAGGWQGAGGGDWRNDGGGPRQLAGGDRLGGPQGGGWGQQGAAGGWDAGRGGNGFPQQGGGWGAGGGIQMPGGEGAGGIGGGAGGMATGGGGWGGLRGGAAGGMGEPQQTMPQGALPMQHGAQGAQGGQWGGAGGGESSGWGSGTTAQALPQQQWGAQGATSGAAAAAVGGGGGGGAGGAVGGGAAGESAFVSAPHAHWKPVDGQFPLEGGTPQRSYLTVDISRTLLKRVHLDATRFSDEAKPKPKGAPPPRASRGPPCPDFEFAYERLPGVGSCWEAPLADSSRTPTRYPANCPSLDESCIQETDFQPHPKWAAQVLVLHNVYVNLAGQVFNETHLFDHNACAVTLAAANFRYASGRTRVRRFKELVSLVDWFAWSARAYLLELIPLFVSLRKVMPAMRGVAVAVGHRLTHRRNQMQQMVALGAEDILGVQLSRMNVHVLQGADLFFAEKLILPLHQRCGQPSRAMWQYIRNHHFLPKNGLPMFYS